MFSRKFFQTTCCGWLITTAGGNDSVSVISVSFVKKSNTMSNSVQLSNSFPTPEMLVLFLVVEPSYGVADLESSYWPGSFGLEEKKAVNSGDAVGLIFMGVSENCPVFSKGSKAACAQVASCKKSKVSRDSNPTSTDRKSKHAKSGSMQSPRGSVSESITGVLETLVSEVKNLPP